MAGSSRSSRRVSPYPLPLSHLSFDQRPALGHDFSDNYLSSTSTYCHASTSSPIPHPDMDIPHPEQRRYPLVHHFQALRPIYASQPLTSSHQIDQPSYRECSFNHHASISITPPNSIPYPASTRFFPDRSHPDSQRTFAVQSPAGSHRPEDATCENYPGRRQSASPLQLP